MSLSKICLTTLLMLQANLCFATVPVTLSGPSPAIPSSLENGTTNQYVFTVTNNVPGRSFPLTVSGLTGVVSRTTVSNDCGNTLPAGPSQCNVGVDISPISNEVTLNNTLTIDYQGRFPLTYPIQVTTFNNTAPSYLMITAGTALGLAQSTDGLTWTKPTVANSPANGDYIASNCNIAGSSGKCVIAGQSFVSPFPPLIAQTLDGGATWNRVTIPGIPSVGGFNSVSCTKEAATICIAAGSANAPPNPPLPMLVKTLDAGTTWSVQPTGIATGSLGASFCGGADADAICIAAGFSGSAPVLLVSDDGAVTWSSKSISGFTSGAIASVACTGDNSPDYCVGAAYDGSTPYIIQSLDAANTWSNSGASLPSATVLQAVACTEDTTGNCVVVGYDATGDKALIATTTNGGTSWSNLSGLQTAGYLNAVSCSGYGVDARCVAAGRISGVSYFGLIYSGSPSAGWSKATISGIGTDEIEFFGASCIGSGPTAICYASGINYTQSYSWALAISLDGGATWAMKDLSSLGFSNAVSFTTAAAGQS